MTAERRVCNMKKVWNRNLRRKQNKPALHTHSQKSVSQSARLGYPTNGAIWYFATELFFYDPGFRDLIGGANIEVIESSIRVRMRADGLCNNHPNGGGGGGAIFRYSGRSVCSMFRNSSKQRTIQCEWVLKQMNRKVLSHNMWLISLTFAQWVVPLFTQYTKIERVLLSTTS